MARRLELTRPADLVRAVVAMQGITSARALLPLIRRQRDSHSAAILFGALCTIHARPFTSNRGLGKLSPRVVPGDLMDTHEKLLVHPNTLKIGANKVAAHLESLALNVYAVFS